MAKSKKDHLDHRLKRDIPKRFPRRDHRIKKDHLERKDNLPVDPLELSLSVLLPETLRVQEDVLPMLELVNVKMCV